MTVFEISAGLARGLEIRSSRHGELLEHLGASASLESWTLAGRIRSDNGAGSHSGSRIGS
jgi:hypothetical protein